jgi:hypothetical protein
VRVTLKKALDRQWRFIQHQFETPASLSRRSELFCTWNYQLMRLEGEKSNLPIAAAFLWATGVACFIIFVADHPARDYA